MVIAVACGVELRERNGDNFIRPDGIQQTKEQPRVDAEGERICHGRKKRRIEYIAIDVQENTLGILTCCADFAKCVLRIYRQGVRGKDTVVVLADVFRCQEELAPPAQCSRKLPCDSSAVQSDR